jgi:hypothetical protein
MTHTTFYENNIHTTIVVGAGWGGKACTHMKDIFQKKDIIFSNHMQTLYCRIITHVILPPLTMPLAGEGKQNMYTKRKIHKNGVATDRGDTA